MVDSGVRSGSVSDAVLHTEEVQSKLSNGAGRSVGSPPSRLLLRNSGSSGVGVRDGGRKLRRDVVVRFQVCSLHGRGERSSS